MTTPAASPAPVLGTPEYDTAMAARADAAGVTVGDGSAPPSAAPAADTPAPVERPSWLPEKFKSAEDMAKAYSALEQKLSGKPQSDDQGGDKGNTPADPPKAPEADPAKAAADAAGLDWDALNGEYAAEGKLSDASLKALADKGFPKHVVDNYIAGMAAQTKAYEAEAFKVAGDEASLRAMQAWAATGMTAAQLAAYNEAVNSGDVAKMSVAVSGLKSMYQAANGADPTLVAGGQAPAGDSFKSAKEVSNAMRDKRYKTDPAYRASVEAKLGRSQF